MAVISRNISAITADNFTIRVEGVREFRAALRAVDKAWPRVMREANLQAAQVVADEAKQRAPVLKTRAGPSSGAPGALRDSIRAGASQAAGYVAVGGARLVYAAVQEFGWPGHNISPQPYIYPAIAAKSNEVLDTYGEAVQRVTRPAFPN